MAGMGLWIRCTVCYLLHTFVFELPPLLLPLIKLLLLLKCHQLTSRLDSSRDCFYCWGCCSIVYSLFSHPTAVWWYHPPCCCICCWLSNRSADASSSFSSASPLYDNNHCRPILLVNVVKSISLFLSLFLIIIQNNILKTDGLKSMRRVKTIAVNII